MKRLLAIILVFFTIFAFCPFAALAEGNSGDSLSLLENIGIINSELMGEKSGAVTREQMALIVAKFLGSADLPQKDTIFADVKADNEYSGYIEYIYQAGIASLNETKTFYPKRFVSYNETVKMIVSALGGDEIAAANGGYPNGYLTVASSLKLLDDVKYETVPSLGEISNIVKNALTAPLYKANSYALENGKLEKVAITSSKDETVLSAYLGISVVNAEILSENKAKKSVSAKLLSIKKKSSDFPYKEGEICTLFLPENDESANLEYTKVEIWVKGENEIVYSEIHRDSKVLWGAIDEVNREDEEGKIYDIRYIEDIAILGGDDYIDIAENCRFFENGKEITSGGINPVGAYAKIVLFKDEITALEIWHLTEGGVITSTKDGIVYSKGVEYGITLTQYDEAKNVNVIINNEPANKIYLTEGVVFDWYYNEKESEIMIVTAGYSVTDEFAGVINKSSGVGSVIIGKDTYDVSSQYGVYCKREGNYFGVDTIDSILGQVVTAYVDYRGEVRYIEVFSQTAQDNEFYGIVLGYQESQMEDDKIKIARIRGTLVDEIDCVMADYVSFPNGVNIKDVLSKISNASNKKDAMKSANILYKFRINQNNKILSIESPVRFDACPETGVTPTEVSGGANPYLYSPRMYFEEDTVFCAYYLEDDEIKVKAVKTAEIAGRSLNNCRMDMFSKGDTSEIEFVLLRGDVETICYATETKIQFGLLTDNMETVEKDQEGRMIRIDGSDYFFSGTSGDNIPKRAFVSYGTTPTFSDNKICILESYSLEGDPSNWKVLDSGSGIREGVIERLDGKRVYFESGSRIYLDNNVKFYKMLPSGRITNAAKSDLHAGDHIYFLYSSSEIQIVLIY